MMAVLCHRYLKARPTVPSAVVLLYIFGRQLILDGDGGVEIKKYEVTLFLCL